MFLKYELEQAWELLDGKLANKESWESNLGNKGKTKTDYECVRKFWDTGESEALTNHFNMGYIDMMQVLEQFTKHLQVPKSKWVKHEGPDELVALATHEDKPLFKAANNSNIEEFLVGIKQEQKGPFSMLPVKKWVHKRGTNELKELMEPDFPRNNIIQLEREATRIIKGKLKLIMIA